MSADLLKTKYQWLTCGEWNRLHFVEAVTDWDDDFFDACDRQVDGERPFTAACGLQTWFVAPGIFSRIGCQRCELCCRKIGITPGHGAAINDITCKTTETTP